MKLELHPTLPFIVAELGTSCDGSVGNMIELAKHAVAAGASAIKVQDHWGQDVPHDAGFPSWFQGSRELESRREYLWRQTGMLNELVRFGPQVPYIASPFNLQLAQSWAPGIVNVRRPDAIKIASGQVCNHALIRACVSTGLPIIVSSGMTTMDETNAALRIIPGRQLWALLDCCSEYPTPPEHVSTGMQSIPIAPGPDGFGEPHMGFSDHTAPDSTAAAIVALTRGARVFERHVCFDQRMYGSDAKNACTLEQFAHYCRELDRASRIPAGDVRDANAERLKDVREAFLVRTV